MKIEISKSKTNHPSGFFSTATANRIKTEFLLTEIIEYFLLKAMQLFKKIIHTFHNKSYKFV